MATDMDFVEGIVHKRVHGGTKRTAVGHRNVAEDALEYARFLAEMSAIPRGRAAPSRPTETSPARRRRGYAAGDGGSPNAAEGAGTLRRGRTVTSSHGPAGGAAMNISCNRRHYDRKSSFFGGEGDVFAQTSKRAPAGPGNRPPKPPRIEAQAADPPDRPKVGTSPPPGHAIGAKPLACGWRKAAVRFFATHISLAVGPANDAALPDAPVATPAAKFEGEMENSNDFLVHDSHSAATKAV